MAKDKPKSYEDPNKQKKTNKDRLVFLSADPDVQSEIARLFGFSASHSQARLPEAHVDENFWHKKDLKTQETTYDPLNLKTEFLGIKNISIVSSKDAKPDDKAHETFYVRIKRGDKTYVGISVNMAYDDLLKKYFDPKNTINPAVIRKSIDNQKLIVVSDAAKSLAPLEMTIRLAAGQEKPVVEKEGYVIDARGRRVVDPSAYMSVAPKVQAQKNQPSALPLKENTPTPDVIAVAPKAASSAIVKSFDDLEYLGGYDYALEKQILGRLALVVDKENSNDTLKPITIFQANMLQYIMLQHIKDQSFDPNCTEDCSAFLEKKVFNGVHVTQMQESLASLKANGYLDDNGVVLAIPVKVGSKTGVSLSQHFSRKLLLTDFDGQTPIFTVEDAQRFELMTDEEFLNAALVGPAPMQPEVVLVEEMAQVEKLPEIDVPVFEVPTFEAAELAPVISTGVPIVEDTPAATLYAESVEETMADAAPSEGAKLPELMDNGQDLGQPSDVPQITVNRDQAYAILQCFIKNGVEFSPGGIFKIQEMGGFRLIIQE